MAESLRTRASLLLRLRDARDSGAWNEFVDLYAPLVDGFCRKQGLQEADAADITQEILGRVFQAIAKLDYDPRRGRFRGWLFTMVRNRLRDFSAQQRRRTAASGGTTVLRQLNGAPTRDGGLEALWEQEYRRQVYAAAARVVRGDVTALTWKAFELSVVEGRSPVETAAELKMSVAAVYLAKSRVMSRLRAEVERLEADDEGGMR
jgi:RNA polymerase sigma-70 factor (ECF subfamily)